MTSDGVCHSIALPPNRTGIGTPWKMINIKADNEQKNIFVQKDDMWWVYILLDQDFKESFSSFILFHPGQYLVIKVKKLNIRSINKNGNCKNLNPAKKYSPYICMAECENEIYLEKFKCKIWIHSQSRFDNLSEICNYQDTYDGQSKLLDIASTYRHQQIHQQAASHCSKQCPYECDRTTYEISIVSQIPLESSSFSRHLLHETKAQQNMTITIMHILHAGVTDGGVMIFEEVKTYTFISLVDSIGGTLGLFVGGTLMTMVQLLVFFVRYCMKKMRRSKKYDIQDNNLHTVTASF